MFRKTLFALTCFFALSAASMVGAPQPEAAEPGVMVCTADKNQGGVWKADECTTVRPSPPCSEIDLCAGCGCWDRPNIDPNSVPPDAVGKVKKRTPRKKDR